MSALSLAIEVFEVYDQIEACNTLLKCIQSRRLDIKPQTSVSQSGLLSLQSDMRRFMFVTLSIMWCESEVKHAGIWVCL